MPAGRAGEVEGLCVRWGETHPGDFVASQHERFAENEMIMDHHSHRHDHQPSPGQLVPTRPCPNGKNDGGRTQDRPDEPPTMRQQQWSCEQRRSHQQPRCHRCDHIRRRRPQRIPLLVTVRRRLSERPAELSCTDDGRSRHCHTHCECADAGARSGEPCCNHRRNGEGNDGPGSGQGDHAGGGQSYHASEPDGTTTPGRHCAYCGGAARSGLLHSLAANDEEAHPACTQHPRQQSLGWARGGHALSLPGLRGRTDGERSEATSPLALEGRKESLCPDVTCHDGLMGSVGGQRTVIHRRALDVITPGSTTGPGSLPHRRASSALAFSFDAYDVPVLASLPRRSPAESPIAQALAGVAGVTFGQYGTFAIDGARLTDSVPVITDLGSDAFGSFRAGLTHMAAIEYAGPITWRLVGPITLGLALRQAGAPADRAFAVAQHAVRGHAKAMAQAVRAVAPRASQMVIFEEQGASAVSHTDFPLAPGEAVDVLSGALAAVEHLAVAGVQVGRDCDIGLVLDAGPDVLALPTFANVGAASGHIDQFLRRGGWVIWGAAATEGPIGDTPTRAWQRLTESWCQLVQQGCEPLRLREQCMFAPAGGLAGHNKSVVDQVTATVAAVARLARGEGSTARFLLGA